MSHSPLTHSCAWQALTQHQQSLQDTQMQALFDDDPTRAEQFSLTCGELQLDYSKNLITDETRRLLLNLANTAQVSDAIAQLHQGAWRNQSEQRAVFHTALRDQSDNALMLDGQDVAPAIQKTRKQMRAICEAVHSGKWQGYDGQAITDVVHIGIGGSYLGPQLVTEALAPYATENIRCHFVADIDPMALAKTLQPLSSATTLFIICSKTFTTQETFLNADAARRWLLQRAPDEAASISKHFIAITSSPDKATAYGIAQNNILAFADWVGGRYSIWSAVGLSAALSIGMDNFEAFLAGAHEMDQHAQQAKPADNMPLMLALLGIWYRNFWGMPSQVLCPYAYGLRHLPNYIQQLDMESNGKRVTQQGEAVDYATAPISWGNTGSQGQHAFFQWLHQGTGVSPVDFIVPLQAHQKQHNAQHAALVANALAQSRALMCGQSAPEGEEHRNIPGNKPNNVLLCSKITPHTLGMLLSLYEHKTFIQSVVWQINSFDQWGVELGKRIAKEILPGLEGTQSDSLLNQIDSSTQRLVDDYRANNPSPQPSPLAGERGPDLSSKTD